MLIRRVHSARRACLATAAAALALGTTFAAWAGLSMAGGATVGFQAKGPAGMSIDGSTTNVSVSDDGQNLLVNVNLGSLGTGMALRDTHMKEALQTSSFPLATLSLPRSALQVPSPGQSTSGNVGGQLTLHGQSHGVSVHYDVKNEGGPLQVSASFPVSMTDYGIVPPSYLGVSVKPGVSVWAKLQLQDR